MKKFSKILIVALTLAVLLCSAFAISASAEETNGAVAASEDGGKWVISKNVSYSENIHLLLAIDANKVEDPELLSVKISVPGVDAACEEFLRCEFKEDLYGEYDEGAVPAYIIHTLGVAAKDMADELTIEIVYNGATVETTTYSVAEYFFERLYKDEFILATDGEALNKKELYLASLKYGNAAQKLLSAADALYIEDAIYVGGLDGVDPVYDPNNLLSLKGIYEVKSFVDGEVVTSVVTAGDFLIKNHAMLKQANRSPYAPIPEGSIGFEAFDEGTWAKGLAGNVDIGYSSQQAKYSVEVRGDNANKYLTFEKTDKANATSAAMAWLAFENEAAVAEGPVIFEADVRFEKLVGELATNGNESCIRFYTDRDGATANGGTKVGEFGFVTDGTNIKINGSSVGYAQNEWFTLRLVLETDKVSIYYVNKVGDMVLLNTKTITGVGAATAIQFTAMTNDCVRVDFDNVYFGSALPLYTNPEILPVNESQTGVVSYANLTTDNNGNGCVDSGDVVGSPASIPLYDENGNPVPQWKGSVTICKDILTDTTIMFMDDIARGSTHNNAKLSKEQAETLDVGQGIVQYPAGNTFTSTIVAEADLCLDYSTLGTFNNGNLFRLQIYDTANKSFKNAMGVKYNLSSNGYVYMDVDGFSKETTVKRGEWFHVRYEYTYADGNVTTKIVVTDVRNVTTEYEYTCANASIFDPTGVNVRASVVPSRDYASLFGVKNVVVTEN